LQGETLLGRKLVTNLMGWLMGGDYKDPEWGSRWPGAKSKEYKSGTGGDTERHL